MHVTSSHVACEYSYNDFYVILEQKVLLLCEYPTEEFDKKKSFYVDTEDNVRGSFRYLLGYQHFLIVFRAC